MDPSDICRYVFCDLFVYNNKHNAVDLYGNKSNGHKSVVFLTRRRVAPWNQNPTCRRIRELFAQFKPDRYSLCDGWKKKWQKSIKKINVKPIYWRRNTLLVLLLQHNNKCVIHGWFVARVYYIYIIFCTRRTDNVFRCLSPFGREPTPIMRLRAPGSLVGYT